MAASITGKEYTVTAAAVSLTTALGLSSRSFISHITFRAGSANAGTTFLGKSNVTVAANRIIFLAASESFSIALESAHFSSDDLYIIGTASDILHIVTVQ